jgi:opacity protein-like surface antigen
MIAKIPALSVVLGAWSAAAQTTQGDRWYGALDLGYHWPGPINSHSTGDAPDGRPYDWRWRFNSDAAIAGRLGYRLTTHLRVEAEVGFQHTRVASVHAPGAESGGVSVSRPGEPYGLCAAPPVGGQCSPAGGINKDITAIYTGMANAIYDVSPDQSFDPFIGAGVGLAHIEALTTYWFSNVPGATGPGNPPLQRLKLAGTLTRPGEFAVQGLAGVSYRVSRRIHMDLTYRYYFTPGALRWNPLNATSPALAQNSGLRPGDFIGRFDDQSVTLGLRYDF